MSLGKLDCDAGCGSDSSRRSSSKAPPRPASPPATQESSAPWLVARFCSATAAVVRARYSFSAGQSWEGSRYRIREEQSPAAVAAAVAMQSPAVGARERLRRHCNRAPPGGSGSEAIVRVVTRFDSVVSRSCFTGDDRQRRYGDSRRVADLGALKLAPRRRPSARTPKRRPARDPVQRGLIEPGDRRGAHCSSDQCRSVRWRIVGLDRCRRTPGL